MWLPCKVVGSPVSKMLALNLFWMTVVANASGSFCQSPPMINGAPKCCRKAMSWLKMRELVLDCSVSPVLR